MRSPLRRTGLLIATGICLWLVGVRALAQATGAEALRQSFEQARTESAQNGMGSLFERPVYLQSHQAGDQLQGDVHAVLNHRFAKVQRALTPAAAWCRVLILHLNVKYCRAARLGQQDQLDVGLGRKFDQALSEVHWLRFNYRTRETGSDFFRLDLQAPDGPLGTRNYRIEVQAMPLNAEQTLLHMRYSYGFGRSARWAMQVYLATLGRGKVGFSQETPALGGPAAQVSGLRGVLERNTVRYYLAIESFLDVQSLPTGDQMQRSLEAWFDATERYPQLHELDRQAYLVMKRQEVGRQARELPPGAAD